MGRYDKKDWSILAGTENGSGNREKTEDLLKQFVRTKVDAECKYPMHTLIQLESNAPPPRKVDAECKYPHASAGNEGNVLLQQRGRVDRLGIPFVPPFLSSPMLFLALCDSSKQTTPSKLSPPHHCIRMDRARHAVNARAR